MDAEAAATAVGEGGVDIRFGGLGEVEGRAAIGEGDVDGTVVVAHANAGGVGHTVAASVADGVDEELFEDEVELEFGVGEAGVLLAKAGHFAGEPFELAN